MGTIILAYPKSRPKTKRNKTANKKYEKERVIPAFNYFRVNYNISHRKTPGERCTYFSAKKKKSKLCVVNYLFTFISNYLNELKKILNKDKHFF